MFRHQTGSHWKLHRPPAAVKRTELPGTSFQQRALAFCRVPYLFPIQSGVRRRGVQMARNKGRVKPITGSWQRVPKGLDWLGRQAPDDRVG